MAQVRGCLKRIFTPSTQLCCLRGKAFKVQSLNRFIVSELLVEERTVCVFLPQSYSQCRGFCSKAANVEKRQDKSITVSDGKNIAGNDRWLDIKTSNSVQFLLEVQDLDDSSITVSGLTLNKSKACFQRLAELVTEDNELKDKKAMELFHEPLFQKMSDFIENRLVDLNSDYLCSVLGSLLQMTIEDIWLIKRIEATLLERVEDRLTIQQAKQLVEIHKDHQETELRQSVCDAAMKVVQEWPPDSVTEQLYQALQLQDDANSTEIQELLEKVLINAKRLHPKHIHKLLVLLSVKKIRNVPLITAMVENVQNKTLFYTPKQLRDMFFACNTLSIQNQILLTKLTQNLLNAYTSEHSEAKVLYPILLSCSRLGWKYKGLVPTLIDKTLHLLRSDSLQTTKLASIMVSLGHLNWTGKERPTFFDEAIKKLERLKEENPKLWLEVVWSLAILKKAPVEMIQDVLLDGYCQQIEKSVADEPIYIKTGVQKKLLNLTGYSVLQLNTAKLNTAKLNTAAKPAGYDTWMKSLKENVKNQDHSSPMRKAVGEVLKSLDPISLSTNTLLDYGHVVDFELQVSQTGDTNGDAKTPERVAVKLWDFKDMLRTDKDTVPTGENAMCTRHLRIMDYAVVTVPYDVWIKLDDTEQKQEYLSNKIKNAITKKATQLKQKETRS